MTTYVVYEGRIITRAEKARFQSNYFDDKRSDLPCPYVAPAFPEHQSMIDGRWISDRGFHRRHLRTHGMEEVGNEPMNNDKPRQIHSKHEVGNAVKEAIEQLEAGYVPPPETDVADEAELLDMPAIKADDIKENGQVIRSSTTGGGELQPKIPREELGDFEKAGS